jgi:hypothetical protein
MEDGWVPIYFARSEADQRAAVRLLEARGIRPSVRNDPLGGLFPGVQAGLYSVRVVLVPGPQAARARDLLGDLVPSGAAQAGTPPSGIRDRLRRVLAALGWN